MSQRPWAGPAIIQGDFPIGLDGFLRRRHGRQLNVQFRKDQPSQRWSIPKWSCIVPHPIRWQLSVVPTTKSGYVHFLSLIPRLQTRGGKIHAVARCASIDGKFSVNTGEGCHDYLCQKSRLETNRRLGNKRIFSLWQKKRGFSNSTFSVFSDT